MLIASPAMADFNYQSYKLDSLNNIIKNLNLSPTSDYEIEAGEYKYKVVVKYTGHQREISKESKELIHKWVFSTRKPPELEEYFKFEIEVQENGKNYWLPIQQVLVDPFLSEVKVEGTCSLYIMFTGTINHSPIFIVNEFNAK